MNEPTLLPAPGSELSGDDTAPARGAFGLLSESLSSKGVRLTRDIMRLNETLAELTGDHEFLGEWLYFITIIGKPSATEP